MLSGAHRPAGAPEGCAEYAVTPAPSQQTRR